MFSETSTIAALAPQRGSARPPAASKLPLEQPHGENTIVPLPQLPVSVGRAFASINGDINPIHMSPKLARLFGFRSNIAHGMMLVGCVHEALSKGGASVGGCAVRGAHARGAGVEICSATYPQTVRASFVRPCLLPAQCSARVRRQDAHAVEWEVMDAGGRVLVTGEINSNQS